MRRTAYIVACVLVVATRKSPSGADEQRRPWPSGNYASQVRDRVAKHYYDEKFHGLDLNAHCDRYKKHIAGARTMPDALRVIAAFLAGLKDSHTFLEPPRIIGRQDYGYVLQTIGDRAYVVQVRPGADAANKPRPGEEVLGLNGYTVNRADLWPLWYALTSLQPVTATAVKRRTPDGKIKTNWSKRPPSEERKSTTSPSLRGTMISGTFSSIENERFTNSSNATCKSATP